MAVLTYVQKALLYELLKRKDDKGPYQYHCRQGCSRFPTVERLNTHNRSKHAGIFVYPKLEDGHRILDYPAASSWKHLWENMHAGSAASAPSCPLPARKMRAKKQSPALWNPLSSFLIRRSGMKRRAARLSHGGAKEARIALPIRGLAKIKHAVRVQTKQSECVPAPAGDADFHGDGSPALVQVATDVLGEPPDVLGRPADASKDPHTVGVLGKDDASAAQILDIMADVTAPSPDPVHAAAAQFSDLVENASGADDVDGCAVDVDGSVVDADVGGSAIDAGVDGSVVDVDGSAIDADVDGSFVDLDGFGISSLAQS